MKDAHEGHLEVPRSARFWALGWEVAAPAEIWFVLHGYGQLARRFLRRFTYIDDGTRLILAPEALSRFYLDAGPGRHGPTSPVGATWMTREDREREIADYVGYLDRLLERVGPRGGAPVTLLGFSQGVATAVRWSVLGRVRPARLVLWGDTLPPDLDERRAAAAWEDVELLLVRGSRDGAFSPERTVAERRTLERLGTAYRLVPYEGGHDIDPPTLRALAAGG